MDNRVFNVNGSGTDLLLAALKLAFAQEGYGERSATAWVETEDCGLILCWVDDDKLNTFPAPLSAEQCLPLVEQWLEGDFAETVKPSKWCGNADHDGSNSRGWQVYVDDWGHVGIAGYRAICGIKPAFMWHGK